MKCEKCKKESSPKNMVSVGHRIGEDNEIYYFKKPKLLCDDCYNKMWENE